MRAARRTGRPDGERVSGPRCAHFSAGREHAARNWRGAGDSEGASQAHAAFSKDTRPLGVAVDQLGIDKRLS